MSGRHPDAFVDMLGDMLLGGEPGEPVAAVAPGSSVALNPPSNTYRGTGVLINVVDDFGADPTGVADATARIQAAHDALPANGGALVFPGRFLTPQGLTFSKPVKAMGFGKGYFESFGGTGSPISALISLSGTVDLLTISANGCIIEDLAFLNQSVGTPTAGAGIKATNGRAMTLRGILVSQFYNCIDIGGGSHYYTIRDFHILDPVNWGIYIHSTVPNGDWGDASITDGFILPINTARNGNAGIRWESGGGVKVTSVKINGNWKPDGTAGAGKLLYGIDIEIADGVTTNDWFVTACSIENWSASGAGMFVGHKGPGNTGLLGTINVGASQFGFSGGAAISMQSAVPAGISGIDITGNTFTQCGYLTFQNVDMLTIGPNMHKLPANNDIISFGSSVTNAHVDPQTVGTNSQRVLFDGTVGSTSHGPFAQSRWDFDREIPSCTSSVTYVTLWRLVCGADTAGLIEVTLAGFVGTKTQFLVNAKRGYMRAGAAAATVTLVGTDAALGTVVDVLFDVAAVTGEVQIKLRINAGAGGTDIFGRASLHIDGPIYNVTKGP